MMTSRGDRSHAACRGRSRTKWLRARRPVAAWRPTKCRLESACPVGDDGSRKDERRDLPEEPPNEELGGLLDVARVECGSEPSNASVLQVAAHPRGELRRRKEKLGEWRGGARQGFAR